MTKIYLSPVTAIRVKFGRDSNGNRIVTARRAENRGSYVRRQVDTLDTHSGNDYERAAEVVALLVSKLSAEYIEIVETEDSPWSGAWTLAFVSEGEYIVTHNTVGPPSRSLIA